MRKISITQQFRIALNKQLTIGESKHQAKIEGSDGGIYSWNTYHTYKKHSQNFARWVKDIYGVNSMDAAKPYIEQYLEYKESEGCSPYTIKTYASAICKAYKISLKDLDFTFKERKRENITRSRLYVKSDADRLENAKVVRVAKHTGLRRSELTSLVPEQLKLKDGQFYITGVHGKGGRVRNVPILNNDAKTIKIISGAARCERVFTRSEMKTVPDVHGYRREYAQALYKTVARPLKDVKGKKIKVKGQYKNAIYYCRTDGKGEQFDRGAMLYVSKALGHSREEVVGRHYLI